MTVTIEYARKKPQQIKHKYDYETTHKILQLYQIVTIM